MQRRHFILQVQTKLREYWSANKRDEMAGHARACTQTLTPTHKHRIVI